MPRLLTPYAAARGSGSTAIRLATKITRPHASTRAGAALGPYAFALCLTTGGFVASAAGQTVAQSGGALAAIRYGFGLLPAVVMVVAVLLQRRYTLDRAARAEG